MNYCQNELMNYYVYLSRQLYNSLNHNQKKLLKSELFKNGFEKIILVDLKRVYSIKLVNSVN